MMQQSPKKNEHEEEVILLRGLRGFYVSPNPAYSLCVGGALGEKENE